MRYTYLKKYRQSRIKICFETSKKWDQRPDTFIGIQNLRSRTQDTGPETWDPNGGTHDPYNKWDPIPGTLWSKWSRIKYHRNRIWVMNLSDLQSYCKRTAVDLVNPKASFWTYIFPRNICICCILKPNWLCAYFLWLVSL